MTVERVKSVVLREYGSFSSFQKIAAEFNLDKVTFLQLFQKAIKNLAKISSRKDFIEYKTIELFRFIGIAGVLTLSPRHRLEIVPKFLDEESSYWREDFLRIALLTHHGHLFRNFLTTSARTSNSDLYDIITQTWIDLFESNRRTLLRTYINTTWADFYLDGDIDEEDLFTPTSEGFLQQGIKLSKSNRYNNILLNAAQQLRNRASYPKDILRLDRAVSVLIDATKDMNKSKRILRPLRDIKWASLMELSEIVLSKDSVGYSGLGSSFLPGYILKTHEAWEKLMFIAVKKYFKKFNVNKINYPLGMRMDGYLYKKPLASTPDISIILNDKSTILVDAKYKIVSDNDIRNVSAVISSTDIYESLAFLRAAKTNLLFLLYPNRQNVNINPANNQPKETFICDEDKIIALSIGVTGISGKDGFSKLVNNVGWLISQQ